MRNSGSHIIYLLLFFFSLHPFEINAQVEIDSLFQKLNLTDQDTSRIGIYNKIAEKYTTTYADYPKAIEYAKRGLELAQNTGNKPGEMNSYFEIAKAYYYSGNYQMSLEYYLRQLKLAESLEDAYAEGLSLNGIGSIHYVLEEYDEALDYYNRGYEKYASINYNRGIAKLYSSMANIYDLSKHDTAKATSYYLRGLKISKEINDTRSIAVVYNNIGCLYLENKVYNLAKEYLDSSVTASKHVKDTYFSLLAYHNLGDYYIQTRQYDSADYYLTLSFEIASKNNHTLRQKDVAMLLSQLYEKQSKYDKAYKYYQIHSKLNDSLSNSNSIQKIEQLKRQYELEQQEQEQKIQKIILEKRKRILQLLTGGCILFFLMTIGFFLYRQRSKIKRQHLEKKILQDDLEYKNKDLVTKTIYLTKSNELITDILKKLKVIKYDLKKENQKSVQPIINELQMSMKDDVWKEFEMRFTQVYSGFYKNLNKKFPDLTPNEKKLCAFLRLNMSTKEIAAITYQSHESIRVARIRLRKKFNISNEDIGLINFLTQF